MVFDTWGGVHGSSAALWKAIRFAATTGLPDHLRDLRLYALHRALSVKIALAVASQLETLQLTSPIVPSLPGKKLFGNTRFSFS